MGTARCLGMRIADRAAAAVAPLSISTSASASSKAPSCQGLPLAASFPRGRGSNGGSNDAATRLTRCR